MSSTQTGTSQTATNPNSIGDQPRTSNAKRTGKSASKRRTKAQIAAARTAPNGTSPATVPTIKPTPARAAAMAVRASHVGSPPALMMDLVQQLPTTGTAFSAEQRKAWLAAGTAILDVLYPIAKAA